MVHAMVLAALSSCGNAGTQVQSAQALLTRAQSLIDAKQPGAAEPYHQAVHVLDGVAQTATAGCDKHEYDLALLLAQLRALLVATELNETPAPRAYSDAVALDRGYYSSYPNDSEEATRARGALTEAIRNKVSPQVLQAAHFPSPGSCAISNIGVDMAKAVVPDFPPEARQNVDYRTTVRVNVLVDPDGAVSRAAVVQSSGNDYLDRAAVAAASASKYLPAVADCVRVPKSYLFVVTFDPDR